MPNGDGTGPNGDYENCNGSNGGRYRGQGRGQNGRNLGNNNRGRRFGNSNYGPGQNRQDTIDIDILKEKIEELTELTENLEDKLKKLETPSKD